jgi:uncharacterized RDD family membrane protein YckC
MELQGTLKNRPAEAREQASPRRSPGVQLASIGLRSSAFLLDYILTLLVPAITVLIAIYFKRRWAAPGVASVVLILGYFVTAALVIFNVVFLTERYGQTLGKRFLGIRIIREDGGSVTYKTALLRHLIGYPLSILLFGLGICWALWDVRQQGWHDKLAHTLVVKD